MSNVLYWALSILLVLYLAVLFAINRFPNITIKSLGFFSLRGIIIETPHKIIRIKRLRLRVNFFRGKDSPLKLFNLEVFGAEVKVLCNDKPNVVNEKLAKQAPFDLEKFLKLTLSKRIYEIIFYYSLLNQVHVLFYRCSVHHEEVDKNVRLHIDYAKLENTLRYDGHNSLTLLVFNGFLHELEDHDRIQIFRNVEVILGCDAIFNCSMNQADVMEASLTNFSLVVSLGKAHVPLDHVNFAPKVKGKDSQHHPISKEQIHILRQFWKIFSEARLSLEEFTLSSGPCLLQVATFQASLTHDFTEEVGKNPIAGFNIHVTSLKLFEAETKCFELPAVACNFEANPFGLLEGIENSHHEELIKEVCSSSDIKFNLTVTNPTVDLYHDQLIMLQIRNRTKQRKPQMTKVNFMNFLLALHKVSTKIVIVDTKIIIHLPAFGSNEFHREAKSNLILKYTVDSLVQRFVTTDLSKSLLEGKESKQQLFGLFKIKNFKANLLDNVINVSKCNLLAVYNINERDVSLKMNCKRLRMKSINSAIFHLVRDRRTKRIILDNQLYNDLMLVSKENNPSKCAAVDDGLYYELFEMLPPIINHLKVEVNEVHADMICKDGLPSQIYTDPATQQQYDLKDYGRGVSLKLNHASLKYKKDSEEVFFKVSELNCFTLSELDLDYVLDFDIVSAYSNGKDDFSDVSSLESIALAATEEDELRKVKQVFKISEVEINNISNKQRDKNRLSVRIPEIEGRVDIFFAWCSIYAISLIKAFKPTVERVCSKEKIKSMMGVTDKKLKLDIFVQVIAIVTRLANSVDVLTEFDTLLVRDALESKSLEFKYARCYLVHPTTKLWARFLTIKNSFVAVNAVIENEDAFEVACKGIRLNIPHGFLFYSVIDNVVTFGKAIKQISNNFKNFSKGVMDFGVLPQEARGAFHVPTVNIKTDNFAMTLENDPFENELSYILELGKVEQNLRTKKYQFFEKQAKVIMDNTLDSKIGLHFTDSPLSTNNVATNSKKQATPINLDSEISRSNTNDTHLLSDEEAKKRIEEALYILERELSTSWYYKFKKFRATKIQNWSKRLERGWGVEKVNDKITDKFDIMNYLPGPLLMGLIFKSLDLTVSKSTIPDLDKFLFEYGKGQPKLDYSILLPVHLLLKSAAVFAFLKDYSLPLLSFPANDDSTKPAFQLQGNMVINEKLVHRKEEMRQIWVPFSPPMAPKVNEDSFYFVSVTRTLTPVKFMVDLNCDIDTERAAMISWCKSYQGALSAAMSAVDNFTKPKIDDSPLGWWDKTALTLHGQMVFNIPNELCFHMKSSTNPYEMTGRNAGFVFCWKNNVVLKIDGVHSSKELITLNSDVFLLAVPNYSMAEKRSWSLFYDEVTEAVPDIESESKKFQKKVMSLSSDERVQWTLGLLFEGNQNHSSNLSDKEKRTNTFIPHYDVVVTGPNFDWHPDSYKGYRSEYIHLAISVKSVSRKGNSSNRIHLTPLTINYFLYWWHTITEAISLPIRQGPLFDDQLDETGQGNSSAKTSTHLFTVKYQLIFEPLTVSHMLMHSSGEKGNQVAFSGIKGKVGRCILDLHQRKEVLTYVNNKLDIKNQILHLKMNQAEIMFKEADVRIVNAIFPDRSMQSQLDRYLFGTSDSSSGDTSNDNSAQSSGQFLNWVSGLDIQGEDFSWLDQEDFTELEIREVLSPYPKVTILPFFFTPNFTYVREFSLQEEGPYPFGKEDSHNCELGNETPADTQGRLLSNRLDGIRSEIDINEDLLANLKGTEHQGEIDAAVADQILTIQKTIDEYKEKQDLVESLYERITGKIAPGEVSHDESSALSVSRYDSRQLSIYSSHKSYDEMKDVELLNKQASEFHNRFIIHNLQLKWGNKVRDLFMDYMQYGSEKKSEAYFMSKRAVDLVESVINTVPEAFKPTKEQDEFCTARLECEDVINAFDDYLEDIDSETQEAEYKFLVKLVSPQIQLISQKDPESTALVVSKDLELRIMSVNLKGVNKLINADNEISGTIETRYGGLFNEFSVYVFNKKDVVISHPNVPYGYVDSQLAVSWPPWVEYENIHEDCWMDKNLVAERTSMVLSFKKPNYLYIDTTSVPEKNEIQVHVAKFVLKANSQQYSTIYYIITDLLVSGKNEKSSLMNKLDKVVSVSDDDDFIGLDERVKTLQSTIREFHSILLKIDGKSLKLNELESAQLHQLELELEKRKLELSMIMRGLKLRNVKSSNKRASRAWLISIDQIIWHFLDSKNAPLIDLALAKSSFSRLDSVDGSNKNKVQVGIIQGFNLQESAVYPELLSPINSGKYQDSANPLILMTWKMLNPVGGIPIMQQAKLSIQPLKIQLDYTTAKLLFEYVFPKSDSPTSNNTPRPRNSIVRRQTSSDLSSFDMSMDKIERPKNIFRHFNKKGSPSSSTEDDSSSISSRSHSISTRFSSTEDLSLTNNTDNKPTTKEPGKKKDAEEGDDISLIVSRSSKFISIVDLEVEQFKLHISFKAPKHLNIIDVHNLMLNIPNIRYQNKTWSGEDFILRLRKDITRIILQHTGQIIGNKFKIRKRKLLKEPLKQISNYASFLSVQDLQNNGNNAGDRQTSTRNPHIHHHRHHLADHSQGEDSMSSQGSTSHHDGGISFENLLQEIIDEEEEGEDDDTTSDRNVSTN
ncbi:hypothetical protein PSN45_005087 [Yamadazyma tenuis]|uniref:FMP27 GFWDK domain-containing protein n=1 Tax=Candida tenuis (strain ATCC 10573 / BCRC 21748 / CBS 615 / JCM 9827 / NBRC 10315 / NRRL Y-1498 / VKM Y-70) TaxID=590646 RepID=G3B2R5_CANTC|nr:uncharacterized protein CANTEDRAFT_120679 [Yamadazyma tenuis ATCC 10573]EGV64741.1 hypothetical protein CANTEDRAFT_120679 [Yamadazyma tenuis ATCC 10573]WEJ97533.1 hypothetical protein PSN45_005087 [Yamadazyma tenuis]